MEAKYITASEATKEGYWFKKYVVELGEMPLDAILLFYDNTGAIALATNGGLTRS